MNSTSESVFAEKRDLHIGGTGDFSAGRRGNSFDDVASAASAGSRAFGSALSGVAAAAESLIESAGDWMSRTKVAARNADEFVRTSPWKAVGVVALAGIAAGYIVSRRRSFSLRS